MIELFLYNTLNNGLILLRLFVCTAYEMERSFFLRMKCVLAKRNAGLTCGGFKVDQTLTRPEQPARPDAQQAWRGGGGEQRCGRREAELCENTTQTGRQAGSSPET